MKKVYIYMIVIASIVYICQRLNLALPKMINNYLNDLLCIPIVLSISQFVAQKVKNKPNYKLSKNVIFIIAVYYSVYFEYYLPQIKIRYTSDLIDVGLYFLGAFIFYFLEKPIVWTYNVGISKSLLK